MKTFFTLLTLSLFATFPTAESCDYVFKCSNGVCERVETTTCVAASATPTATATKATVVAPPPKTIVGNTTAVGTTSSATVSGQPEVAAPAATTSPAPSYGAPCAENGSCYGDISTVNGTPKTIHVDGYYRRDGTYVRGHYRSSGKR